MTIKDIARECGCAIGTVSRVINNHPDVSDKTRQKVMAVVEKHGFVLNSNAQQLKAQERKNIVVIVKGTYSPLLLGMLERLQKNMEPLSYKLDVIVLDEDDDEASKALRLYYELKPVGFVFLGGNPDKNKAGFEKIKVPCVLISAAGDKVGSENLSSVSTDNYEASLFSASYLINNGHKKIGVIGGNIEDSIVSHNRYKGFLQAMKNANLEFDYEQSYEISKYSLEGGYVAVDRLLEKNPDITAIYTMSDVMAIGACRRLADKGIKVPDQISVIGFDGIEAGYYFVPRLTTIKQMKNDLVDKGLSVLIDSIENNSSSVHERVPFEFVEGESVKKLN